MRRAFLLALLNEAAVPSGDLASIPPSEKIFLLLEKCVFCNQQRLRCSSLTCHPCFILEAIPFVQVFLRLFHSRQHDFRVQIFNAWRNGVNFDVSIRLSRVFWFFVSHPCSQIQARQLMARLAIIPIAFEEKNIEFVPEDRKSNESLTSMDLL